MPRFVVVPAEAVAGWKADRTTVVEGRFGRVELGRRTLVPWKERGYSIAIPETLCRLAGVDTGDELELEIRLAEEIVPEELTSLLKESPAAKTAWNALTEPQRRMLREEILSLKQAATRARRAERVLLGRAAR